MSFGISDRDLERIKLAISGFMEVEEVIVFGSRAIGNYRPSSSVDLAVKGNRVNPRCIAALSTHLNLELPLTYKFNIFEYRTIDSSELRDQIDRHGQILFSRSRMR